MSRRSWAIITFGLGIALAPLAHQLGSVCLQPLVAQDRTVPEPIERDSNVSATDPQSQPASREGGLVGDSADAFLELAKQKAALLTPEELAREVESLRKELTELRATVQLREAVEKLKQLVGEHPQTDAARKATRMLETEAAPMRGTNRVRSDVFDDDFSPSVIPTPPRTPRSTNGLPTP